MYRTLDVMLAGLTTSGYGAAFVIFQFFISRATGPSLIFFFKQTTCENLINIRVPLEFDFLAILHLNFAMEFNRF